MIRKAWKKIISLTLATIMLCTSIACGANELEETAFPLLVAVDYEDDRNRVIYCDLFSRSKQEDGQGKELPYSAKTGKNFAEAKENYENLLQKVPDYSHLKILLLGEDLVQNPQVYKDTIQTLAQTEEFPRNTYVCVIDEVDDILEIADKLSEDVGSYLENYLENHKQQENNLLSLGDLIDEQENQTLILYAPYFDVEDGIVQMKGQYALEFYD